MMVPAASAAAEDSLWNQPVGSAAMTVLIGFGLLAVGVPITLNWRGSAEGYSRLIDVVTPRLPLLRLVRPVDEGARRRRLVRQNRIVFGVVCLFGVAFFSGGAVSLLRHLV